MICKLSRKLITSIDNNKRFKDSTLEYNMHAGSQLMGQCIIKGKQVEILVKDSEPLCFNGNDLVHAADPKFLLGHYETVKPKLWTGKRNRLYLQGNAWELRQINSIGIFPVFKLDGQRRYSLSCRDRSIQYTFKIKSKIFSFGNQDAYKPLQGEVESEKEDLVAAMAGCYLIQLAIEDEVG